MSAEGSPTPRKLSRGGNPEALEREDARDDLRPRPPAGTEAQIIQEPQVSIVVPVYRNADTLCELHARLGRVFETQQIAYEIIFVDDACPENSLAVLAELAKSDPQVAVLVLEQNVGQQRAVMTGLRHVRGNWVVVMDADLQDVPEAIPDLLKLQGGYAAVFAGRRGAYESPLRLVTSRVFKRLLSWVAGVPTDAGLFVAMNREMVERVLNFSAPHPFLVAMIGCTRLPLASIPVQRAQRPSGESAYSFWKRFKIGCLAIGWALIWKWRPGFRSAGPHANQIPVKAYIGARFTGAQEETQNHAALRITQP